MSLTSGDYLVRGIKGIYRWSLANVISAIIMIIGIVVALASVPNLVAIVSSIVISLLIAIAMALAALYFLYTGFRDLSTYNRDDFGVGYTGVKLVVIGLVLAIVGLGIVITTIASAPFAIPSIAKGSLESLAHVLIGLAIGGILLIVSLILAFIGVVMIAVGLWRLGGIAKDGTLIKVGAVLLVVALILMFFRVGGIVDLVATILIMLGSKRILEELEKRISKASSQSGGDATLSSSLS